MNTLDLIFLGIILFFTAFGFWRGLVLMVGGLVVSILSGFFAGQLSELIAGAISSNLDSFADLTKINWIHNVLFWISFVLLLFVGNIALKFIDILTSVPVIGTFKRMGGMVLGLVQGLLVVGLVAVVLSRYPLWEDVELLTQSSVIVKVSVYLASIVTALWPRDLNQVADLLRK